MNNSGHSTDGRDAVLDTFNRIGSNGGDTAGGTLSIARDSVNFPIGGTVGPDTINGTNEDDLIFGDAGDDSLSGGAGDDVIFGGAGDDTLVVGDGEGNDQYYGDTGVDVITFASATAPVTVSLAPARKTGAGSASGKEIGKDTVDGIENVIGGAGNDRITGDDGSNEIDGGAGADNMAGGLGDDHYVVDHKGDRITEKDGAGTDTVDIVAPIDANNAAKNVYTLGKFVEEATLATAAGAAGIKGNDEINTLTGNGAANKLDGGKGADVLAGGFGNDTYCVDDAGDVVTEAAAAGTDVVWSTVDHTLAGNVENLTLTGKGAVSGTGNSLANVLVGNGNANVLDGGDGGDDLTGGKGKDIFVASSGVDTVTDFKIGEDKLDVGEFALTLGADVGEWDNLKANHLGEDNAGNALINLGTGVVILEGVDGDALDAGDFLGVTTGAYVAGSGTVDGFDTDDILTGGGGPDTLTGGDGDDTVMAGAGDDLIVAASGGGNDEYHGDEGTDVLSFASAGPKSPVTVDMATGTAFGKETGKDVFAGIENVIGGEGNDRIAGDDGDNRIDGGGGGDGMAGGGGGDTYVVDNVRDRVIEKKDGGTDTVEIAGLDGVKAGKTVLFKLATHVENAQIGSGAGAVQIIGNADDNRLTGNGDANKLDGGKGADVLTGGLGDDVYCVDDVGDVVEESAGEGIDAVWSAIDYVLGDHLEDLTLTGKAALRATGNAAANTLVGNARNNILDGGADADILTGGNGKDTIVASGGADTASDFRVGQDKVDVLAFGSAVGSWTALEARIGVDGGGNAVIDFGSGNTLTLEGVDPDKLDADDFVGVTDGAYVEGGANLTGFETDDILKGGTGSDTLSAGAGDDTVAGGDGNDLIVAASGAGNDDYRGEGGEDTVSFESATKPVTVVLAPSKKTGLGAAAGKETGKDGLDGVEHVIGGDGNDKITGDAGANQLSGGGGNDVLNGGGGNDVLSGGAGRDLLIGGDGADMFMFGELSDSPAGKKSRDTIKDFDPLEDVIDLPVDVSFIGADPFSGGGGEARFHKGVLQVDADGGADPAADLEILLARVKPDDLGSDVSPDWLG